MNDIAERLQSQFNVTLAALESANDEVHELRAEIARLHELFRIDGEQHTAYVKTILHDQDTRLAAYKAEAEQLREQVASLQASSGYEASIAQVEVERLREALWFYARPLNYGENPTPMVMRDSGNIARRALEQKP